MNLDVRTLLFAQMLMAFALAGTVLVGRPVNAPEARGVRAWAAGELLYGIGYSALFFVGTAAPLVSGPLANTLLLCGYLAFAQAVAQFFGRPLGTATMALAACAIAAVFLALPPGPEGFKARGMVYAAVLGTLALVAHGLLRRAPSEMRGAMIVRCGFLGQWLLVVLRAAGGTLVPDAHLLSPRTWQSAPFAAHMIVNVASTLGFLMMLQEQARTRSEMLARIDPLTGLLNRRGLLERLHEEMMRADQQGTLLSIVAIDIDHFKQVNDQWGHAGGDRTLGAFAQLLRETTHGGVVGRLGGEEFLMVLPHQDGTAARQLAERVRTALRASPIGPQGRIVTASFGTVCRLEAGAADPAELLRIADERLYEAKRTRDAIV